MKTGRVGFVVYAVVNKPAGDPLNELQQIKEIERRESKDER